MFLHIQFISAVGGRTGFRYILEIKRSEMNGLSYVNQKHKFQLRSWIKFVYFCIVTEVTQKFYKLLLNGSYSNFKCSKKIEKL